MELTLTAHIALFVGFGLLGLLVLAFAVNREKSGHKKTNYRALVGLGAVWLPLGLVTKNPGLWSLGITFLVLGLVNKDKWQDEETWADSPDSQRKLKIALIGGITLFLFITAAFFWMTTYRS